MCPAAQRSGMSEILERLISAVIKCGTDSNTKSKAYFAPVLPGNRWPLVKKAQLLDELQARNELH